MPRRFPRSSKRSSFPNARSRRVLTTVPFFLVLLAGLLLFCVRSSDAGARARHPVPAAPATPCSKVEDSAGAARISAEEPCVSLSAETDHDGLPDVEDLDDDNDGIPDDVDEDDDGDGISDNDEECGDADGDGILNGEDEDDDNDGIPDSEDEDDDGDGIPDNEEGGDDDDGDGIPDTADPDDDGDGIPDADDNDDDNDGIPDDADADDEDGHSDGPDVDDDNDGVPDGQDTDDDNDGVPDGEDTDDDNDGVLDGDDDDDDNDGIPDQDDNEDGDGDNDGIPNYDDPDFDNDGDPNLSDPDDDNDGATDDDDNDDDGNGTPDDTQGGGGGGGGGPPGSEDGKFIKITGTVPQNPTPIKWDGKTPVRLSCTYTANFTSPEHESEVLVALFPADKMWHHGQPSDAPIAVLKHRPRNVSFSTQTATLTWDGTPTDANGTRTNGPSADPGLYKFVWMVEGKASTDMGGWTSSRTITVHDKSHRLNLSPAPFADPALPGSPPGISGKAYYTRRNGATLFFAVPVRLNRAVTRVKVDVYSPVSRPNAGSAPLASASDPVPLISKPFTAPGDVTAADHSYEIGISEAVLRANALSVTGGVDDPAYHFVVSALETEEDIMATKHPARWAFQLVLRYSPRPVSLASPINDLVFKGGPNPCPIVLKGRIRAPSNGGIEPLVMLTYAKLFLDDNGTYKPTPEFQDDEGNLKEKPIPIANAFAKVKMDLMPVGDSDQEWQFISLWSQDLDRTLTTLDNAGQPAKKEFWSIRASAVSQGTASPSDSTVRFRIFMMARPTEGGIFSKFGPRLSSALNTYQESSSGTDVYARLPASTPTNPGNHSGADFEENGALKTINAAETGAVRNGGWKPWAGDRIYRSGENPEEVPEDSSLVDALALNGYGRSPGDLIVETTRLNDITNNLGPNREVLHPEEVVLRLKQPENTAPLLDDPYERSYLVTKYGHMQPETETGDGEISTEIAKIGEYSFNYTDGKLLDRGYFIVRNGTLKRRDFNGNLVEVARDVDVVFTSTGGPHLHFEVRKVTALPTEADLVYPYAVEDPSAHIGLDFGERKRQ